LSATETSSQTSFLCCTAVFGILAVPGNQITPQPGVFFVVIASSLPYPNRNYGELHPFFVRVFPMGFTILFATFGPALAPFQLRPCGSKGGHPLLSAPTLLTPTRFPSLFCDHPLPKSFLFPCGLSHLFPIIRPGSTFINLKYFLSNNSFFPRVSWSVISSHGGSSLVRFFRSFFPLEPDLLISII